MERIKHISTLDYTPFFRDVFRSTRHSDTDIYSNNGNLTKLVYINDFAKRKSYNVSQILDTTVNKINERNKKYSEYVSKTKTKDQGHSYENRGYAWSNNETFDIEPDNEISDKHTRRRYNNCCVSSVQSLNPVLGGTFQITDNVTGLEHSRQDRVNDELLDILQIPEGSERQRKSDFRKWSKYTYEYLRRHLGDEDLVKARRILIDNQFSCMGIVGENSMSSGSKAEGLDIKTSDLDIMHTVGLAYEIDGETFVKEGFLYDSTPNECIPGYTYISLVINSVISKSISSDEFRSSMKLDFQDNCNLRMEDHGPSLSFSYYQTDCDCVYCLKSEEWPRIAYEWKNRKRWFEWPDVDNVSVISQSGCHIVPTGRGNNSFQKEHWRLSFSLAENVLIRSFNHTQLMVYGGLKILFKEVYMQMRHAYKDFISSYILKTSLFWVSEENEITIWYPANTLYCITLCLDRVEKWIQEMNCPNYFVPANNMFYDKYPVEVIPELLHIVSVVKRNMLRFIWQCEILKNSAVEHNSLRACQTTEEKIVFCCLHFMAFSKGLVYSMANNITSNAERCSIANEIFHCHLPKQVKQILYPMLSHFIVNNVTGYSNKKMYYFKKLYLKYVLRCNKMEMVAAKVNMATWFYNQRRYNDALIVLDLVLQRLKFASYYCDFHIIHIDTPEGNIIRQQAKIMEKMKRFCLEMVMFPKGSTLVPSELQDLFGIMHKITPLICINPMTYCYFMRFLCFHRTGLPKERTNSLIDLANVQYFTRSDTEDARWKTTNRLFIDICLMIENMNDENVDINLLLRDDKLIDDLPPDIIEYSGLNI